MSKWKFGDVVQCDDGLTVLVLAGNAKGDFVAEDGWQVEKGQYVGLTLDTGEDNEDGEWPALKTCLIETEGKPWTWKVVE